MTLQELINSELDFHSLAALARRGFAWWAGQLADLVPAGWRERLYRRPRIYAECVADGRWRLWRDGRQITEGLSRSEAQRGIAILLQTSTVLVREVEVPPMSAADVRSMLALDMDRLSPLNPELIHFDFEIAKRGATERGRTVQVGIVRRALAAQAVDSARAAGLQPGRLCVLLDGRGWSPAFDFLPAVFESTGRRPAANDRRWWWGAVAALFAINLAVLVGRDLASVADLERRVQVQQPATDIALRLRAAVNGEEARRRSLLARGGRSEPLAVLNAVTEAIPPGAWVQHLEWNGRNLRLVGFNPGRVDVGAAIRGSGAFTEPSFATSGPFAAGAGQSFDLTADSRARR